MAIDPLAATDLSHSRRTQIQDCLLSLMGQKPYDTITVTEICRIVSISRRGFYYYFPDKDACLCSLITRKLQEFMVYFAAHISVNASALEAYILLLYYWKGHRDFLELLVKNRLTQFLLVMSKDFTLQENFSLLADFPNWDEDVLIGQIGATLAIILRWHHFAYVTPPEEMAVKCLKAIGRWEEPV